MKIPSLELFNVNCEGEIGDVVFSGDFNLKGETLLEQSKNLLEDQNLRNFYLMNQEEEYLSILIYLYLQKIKKQMLDL